MKISRVLSSLALTSSATASFPPQLEDIITEKIDRVPGASISYKETHICETKAKSYAGYVDLPADYISDTQGDEPHNVSIFFWYFEARNAPEKAPTTIYLAGGPGESSVYGATSDGGPCYVLDDSNSTERNPWSWNENVNMLYVDQPVTAGFSYAQAINSTWNLLWDGSDGTYSPATPFEAYNGFVPAENTTFLYGTFPDQNTAYTANTSVIAARTLWHFAQLWFTEFKENHTQDYRINFAGHSYGGFWVSTSMAHFQRQNERIQMGDISGKRLHLDLAVITNGQIDFLHQAEWYPRMAYNNTYGFQAISEDVYKESLNHFTRPDGCRNLIQQCRALGELLDPEEVGIDQDVNDLCTAATFYCYQNVLDAYSATSRSAFDMAVYSPSAYPPSYTTGFANRAWVQRALGARVNFTENSYVSQAVFQGDMARRAGLKDISYLLSRGIRVALVYGDRDYRCPWVSGEGLSLAANWTGAAAYRKAGYEEIHVNSSYVGGVVKQHGLLSFSRVFEAGHGVSWYQPETSYRIFNRAVSGRDISSGTKDLSRHCGSETSSYSTKGPLSAYGWTHELPESPEAQCYMYNIATTCTGHQVSPKRQTALQSTEMRNHSG